jgi:hypothetical protein
MGDSCHVTCYCCRPDLCPTSLERRGRISIAARTRPALRRIVACPRRMIAAAVFLIGLAKFARLFGCPLDKEYGNKTTRNKLALQHAFFSKDLPSPRCHNR